MERKFLPREGNQIQTIKPLGSSFSSWVAPTVSNRVIQTDISSVWNLIMNFQNKFILNPSSSPTIETPQWGLSLYFVLTCARNLQNYSYSKQKQKGHKARQTAKWQTNVFFPSPLFLRVVNMLTSLSVSLCFCLVLVKRYASFTEETPTALWKHVNPVLAIMYFCVTLKI